MLVSYELGGLKTQGIGSISKFATNAEGSLRTFSSSDSNTEILESIHNLVRNSPTQQRVKANGTSIQPLLYWGFIVVVLLSVSSTLMNNTQFSVVEQKLLTILNEGKGNKLQTSSYPIMDIKQNELFADINHSQRTALEKLEEHYIAQQKHQQKYLVNIQDALKTASSTALMLSGVTIVVGLVVATIISRKLVHQINNLNETMQTITKGNYDIDITPPGKVGLEIARMYDAVRIFRDNSKEVSELRQRQAEELRQNLQQISCVLGTQITSIFDQLNDSQNQSIEIAKDMSVIASKLKSTTTQNSAIINETSEYTQTVMDAVSYLSQSMKDIATNANEAKSVSENAMQQAAKSNQCIVSLENVANNIYGVVEIIEKITGQTNLLALNATIEAVRAGEAGKEFSVVASEVKALSSQTKDATLQISGQLETIRHHVGETVEIMRKISQSINSISDFSSHISSMVSNQSAAAEQMLTLIKKVAQEIMKVSQSMDSLAVDAQKTEEVASNINLSAQKTADTIETLGGSMKKTITKLTDAA
jgi:methyl-accepting chemotaxis protein